MNKKPDVNFGTRAVNRDLFGDVIDELLKYFNELSIDGHSLSAGENLEFKGGYLSRRRSPAHYDHLLVLATEFKKIFMDEWSGQLYEDTFEELLEGFSQVVNQIVAHPLLVGER